MRKKYMRKIVGDVEIRIAYMWIAHFFPTAVSKTDDAGRDLART